MNDSKLMKISVIVGIILSVTLIINTSLSAYVLYTSSFEASISDAGESLDIAVITDTGRPGLLEQLFKTARNWASSYYVGGVEKTQATTGISISVTGSNVASQASVTYYIEAKDSTEAGNPYRFLEGTDEAITVGGAPLSPTNQTSIEDHLEAMGLSVTESHTIDYYVYVRVEATGAVSGETLTSEISYTKFDSVSYEYGAEVAENLKVTAGANDYYRDRYYFKNGENWIDVFHRDGYSNTYGCGMVFEPSAIPNGATITGCYLRLCGYGSASGGGAFIYSVESRETPPGGTPTFDAMTYHTPGAFWSFSTTNGAWQNTRDLTVQMQDLVNMAAWADTWDNPHFVILDYNGTSQGFRSYEEGNEPELHITYMGYGASWYEIPPLSVISLPISKDVAAVLAVIIAAFVVVRQKMEENKR